MPQNKYIHQLQIPDPIFIPQGKPVLSVKPLASLKHWPSPQDISGLISLLAGIYPIHTCTPIFYISLIQNQAYIHKHFTSFKTAAESMSKVPLQNVARRKYMRLVYSVQKLQDRSYTPYNVLQFTRCIETLHIYINKTRLAAS